MFCVYANIHVCVGTYRGQRHWIPLEGELQVVVSCLSLVLGTELWSSVRAVHALNYGATTESSL